MEQLKLDFCDFYKGFDPYNNFFYRILSKYYSVKLCSKPDILIFSNYGYNHKNYSNCMKLFFSSENPDYISGENQIYALREYDYLLDHQYINSKRHYRLPLFVCYDGYYDLITLREQKLTVADIKKKKFCNFIYSNDNAKERIQFLHRLNEYRKVDCGGKTLNTIGYFVENKKTFIQDYKFTIAFENSNALGYTTEKLLEPLASRSIPIYWGNRKANLDFNENAFIQLDDISNMDALIAKIIEIDTNDELFLQYINASAFPMNKMPDYAREENFIAFFDTILQTSLSKIKRYYIKRILKDKIY
jgi:alpha(1,3/1,4) fucosyltransferase